MPALAFSLGVLNLLEIVLYGFGSCSGSTMMSRCELFAMGSGAAQGGLILSAVIRYANRAHQVSNLAYFKLQYGLDTARDQMNDAPRRELCARAVGLVQYIWWMSCDCPNAEQCVLIPLNGSTSGSWRHEPGEG